MSSVRTNTNRKRRSDYETSESDSEDDIVPARKIRKCQRETNIRQSLLSKCRNLFQWISELPINQYIKENMYKRSLMYSEPEDVMIIDDEDDDVIHVEDDDDEEDDEVAVLDIEKNRSPGHSDLSCRSCKQVTPETFLDNLSDKNIYSLPRRSKPRRTLSDLHSAQNSFNARKPISTSTPLYRDYKTSYNGFGSSSNMCQKQLNSLDGQGWDDKNGLSDEPVNDIPLRNSSRRLSPITNPGIDVEILLDGKSKDNTGDDSDELEIISEVAPVKQKPGPLSKKLSSQKFVRTVKDRDTNFKDSKENNSSCTEKKSERERTPNNSYTAYEVVRLQEKEQYKLLLDKLVNSSIYHPAVSKIGSKCAEIQVDLTEEEEDPLVGAHFRKEILKQPVSEFLHKYYKPCHLVSSPTLDPSSLIGAERVDDDVQVIEDKLPEYKPRNRTKPDFFSPAWITELKMTITSETERRLQIVAEQEQKIERYRKRRDAKIAEEKRRQCELAMVPVTRADDEFPALTPEMEVMIDSALDPSAANPCLVKLDNLILSSADISTLNGLNWLNDQVINFYMALIVERSKLDNYPSVYAYSSFFYSSLRSRGEQQVTRWTKKVDIFAHDILFIPLHLGMHWALGVIDNRSKKIQYYDSLSCHEDKCLQSFQKYLVAEMKDKKKVVMDPNTYTTEIVKNIPQQMNGSDCGMFTLKYAEYIARDSEITFTQKHMQYFRRRMVYEMLTKQLLA